MPETHDDRSDWSKTCADVWALWQFRLHAPLWPKHELHDGYRSSHHNRCFKRCVDGRGSPCQFSGNTGVAKSVLGEITDDTNISLAFAWFNLTWSLGGIGKKSTTVMIPDPRSWSDAWWVLESSCARDPRRLRTMHLSETVPLFPTAIHIGHGQPAGVSVVRVLFQRDKKVQGYDPK